MLAPTRTTIYPRIVLAIALSCFTSFSHGASFTFTGMLSGALDLGAGAITLVDNPFTLTGELLDVTPDGNAVGLITFFQSTSYWNLAGVGVFEGDVGSSYYTQGQGPSIAGIGFSAVVGLDTVIDTATSNFLFSDTDVFEPQLFTTDVTFYHPSFGMLGGLSPSSLSNSSGHSLSILGGELFSAESANAAPLPATTWLIGSAMLGLLGVSRGRSTETARAIKPTNC